MIFSRWFLGRGARRVPGPRAGSLGNFPVRDPGCRRRQKGAFRKNLALPNNWKLRAGG